MKKNFLLYIIIITALQSCKYTTTVFIKKQPDERIKYPEWHVTSPKINLVGTPGQKEFKWKMKARGDATDKIVDSVVFCLSVKKDVPVTIEVNSKKGYPVILATDRPIHKNDIYLILNGIEMSSNFPGRPLTYSISNNSNGSLCINPPYSTVLNIWIWLIEGQMIDEEYSSGIEDLDDLDTMEINLTNDMIQYSLILDSLSHYNKIEQAWNNSGQKNKTSFKKSKVKVNIKKGGDINCLTLRDHFYDLYNCDRIGIVINTPTDNGVAKMENWKEISDEYDNQKSISFKNANAWKNKEINYSSEFFDIRLESKLKILEMLPDLQHELYKREMVYNSGMDSTEIHEYILAQFAFDGGDSAILKKNLSIYLTEFLPKIGANSIALYDRFGYVVASTDLFLYMNIKNQKEWGMIENSTQDIISSGCYNLTGYTYKFKKVFIPIKKLEGDEIIGWLMTEIYCN